MNEKGVQRRLFFNVKVKTLERETEIKMGTTD
jgi:hypothetical protein